MENKKTTPQDRWQAKVGLISKSYKLHKDVVEQFAAACEKAGVSQASQLTRMMKEFTKEQRIEGAQE